MARSECPDKVVEDLRPQLLESTKADYVSEAGLHYKNKKKSQAEAEGEEETKR